MRIDAAAQMNRVFPKHLEEFDKPVDRPGHDSRKPVADLGGSAERMTLIPPVEEEGRVERGRQLQDQMMDLDFKMKFKAVQRHRHDDDSVGIKMKMKAKLHGRIDDYSVKMKQEVKASFKLESEGESQANKLHQKFEFELKIKVDQHVESEEGAERFAELLGAFGAIFQGFMQGLGETFGQTPPAEPTPVFDDPIVEDPKAPVVPGIPETPLTGEQTVVGGPQQVVVEKPFEIEEPTAPVVEEPVESTPLSPLQDLVSRLTDLFANLTSELMEILGGFEQRVQPVGDDDENGSESSSFDLRVSFKFEAHMQYEQNLLPESEPLVNLEA